MSIPVTLRPKLYTVFYRSSTDEVDLHSKWGQKCMYGLFYLHIFLSSLRHKLDTATVRISTASLSRSSKTRKVQDRTALAYNMNILMLTSIWCGVQNTKACIMLHSPSSFASSLLGWNTTVSCSAAASTIFSSSVYLRSTLITSTRILFFTNID
jgi:hypothetical protein